MPPALDHRRPPTTTVSTSAAVAANSTCAGQAARGPDRVQPHRDQVGGRRPERSGRPPASPGRRVPAAASASTRAAGVKRAAPTGAQPLVHLQPARLLEQVDHRVLVAAQRERRAGVAQFARAGPMPSARSRSVVGHRQAQCPAVAEQPRCRRAVRWVACTAVVAAPSTPCSASSAVGVTAVARRGTPRSRPAARTGGRAAAGRPRPRPPRRSSVGRHRPDRVDRRADPERLVLRAGRPPAPPSPPRHRRRSAPARRSAAGTALAVQPAGEVAGVEQGDPDARRAGRPRAAPPPIALGSA